MRPALEATPKRVPAVSKRLTKRKDIIMLNIAMSKAPMISNFRKTGEISGGKANTPSKFTRLVKALILLHSRSTGDIKTLQAYYNIDEALARSCMLNRASK